MASSNTANWSVYSRNGEANVEGLLSWFEGPKYLPFALSATRIHLTPTSYQQTRQLFIRHKLVHQSQIRELPSGRPQSKGWERKGGLWLTALPFTQSTSPILSRSVPSRKLQSSNKWNHTTFQVKEKDVHWLRHQGVSFFSLSSHNDKKKLYVREIWHHWIKLQWCDEI